MGDLDQRERPLADRLPEQIGDAILGDDVVHVRPRNAYAVAGLEQGLDPRGAGLRGGGEADDGLAAG